jgi:hypothetical protein
MQDEIGRAQGRHTCVGEPSGSPRQVRIRNDCDAGG